MIFKLIEDNIGCEAGLRELLKNKNVEVLDNKAQTEETIAVSLELCEEKKVSVCYENKTAKLKASDKTFFFRACMTLLRELEKRGEDVSFTLEEEVWLDKNGTMFDCSRNSVLTVDTIKEYIRMQAALGMNTMMLYTEDTYEVPEYPHFGSFRGRYSQKELKEVDAYADMFGIEVIPCIQTLAHLANPLRWQAMQHLRDMDYILMVGDENVYTFIETCIRRASECFKTKRIHLGMDEAWQLGLGKYLTKNGYHTKAEIMAAHMERVTEICKKYELEPMIWSDMYLCTHAEDETYYGVPLDRDLSDAVKPPKEVTLVYWDYYHGEKKFYEEYLRMHRQLSDKVIFAGGGWVWNGISPNLTVARENTEAGLAACKEKGVREAICTMWQDDGAETPMAAGITSIVRFAEHGFTKEVTEEQLKEQFEFLTGADYEAFMMLDKFDHIQDSKGYVNPSKYLLYQDVLMGLYDAQIVGWHVEEHYADLRDRLYELMEKKAGNYMDDVLEMYYSLADLLSFKGNMGNRLCEAYKSQDKQTLKEIAEEIAVCIEGVESYRTLREKVWNHESKIFGFEVIDLRLGALDRRLKTAQKRVTAYVNGELERLPELEEERLLIRPEMREDGRQKLAGCNVWSRIVSPSQV